MKINTLKTELIILGVIVLLGFVFRLINYTSFSLSNDELSALYRVYYENFSDLFNEGVGIDFHPGGVQIFLYYWVKLFGDSVASIRLPFIISGTLAILLMYLFSRRWFGPTPSLLAASAIAFLEFPLLYSQIARPYSTGLMLILFLAWTWSIVLKPKESEKKNIWLYSILLGLAFALNLYNHYFSALLAFIIGLSGFAILKKEQLKPYLISAFFASLLFVPHIKMTLFHMSKGGLSSWLAKPSIGWPLLHLAEIFNSSISLLILVASLIIAIYFISKTKLKKSIIRPFLLIWFLLPLSIGYFYSLFVNPVLQHSILIFSFPFFILFIFSFIPEKLDKKGMLYIVLFSTIFITHSIFIDDYYNKNHFQNFKEIAEDIKQSNMKYSGIETTRVMESNSPNYIKYYLKKDTNKVKFDQWKIKDESDLIKLNNLLNSSSSDHLEYVILATENKIARNMIFNRFPYILVNKNYRENAQYLLLSKKKYEYATDSRKINSFVIDSISYNYDTLQNLSNTEFSSGFEHLFSIQEIEAIKDNNFIVIVSIEAINLINKSNSHIVFQIESPDDRKLFWSSAPLRYFLEKDKLKHIFFDQDLPRINEPGTKLKVYIWNPEKETFYINNFNIRLCHSVD